MRELTYAPWVEPVARMHAGDRAAVVSFARAAPAEFWPQPSPVPGWSNHDLLAHLAGGNDQLLQTLLRIATGHADVDPSQLDPDTDAENAARVNERRGWQLVQLIDELVRDDAEIQEMLSELTVDDEGRRFEGFAITLGQFLKIVLRERHDHEHLMQLQEGIDG